MTSEQSKLLKVGDVFRRLNGSGKVIDTQSRCVTIKWEDGHKGFTGHNEMQRVEQRT